MSDEPRSMLNDSQLTELFRSYVDTGVRPFDPGAIASYAIGHAQRRSPTRWLPRVTWHARRPSLLVALGVLLLCGAVTLAGAALLLDRRPVPGFLAVWGYSGRGAEIRTIGPEGTVQTIISSTDHVAYPIWSPDGTRIAYSDYHSPGPVRVVNADGTGARSVTDGYISPYPVAWSPDGGQLAFEGSRNGAGLGPSVDHGLYVVNGDGTSVVKIADSNEPGVGRLAWAPDGSLISRVAGGPGRTAFLQVVDPRTGEASRVSELPLVWDRDYAAPSWSPDSSRLLYAVEDPREGRAGIAVAQRTGSGWVEKLVFSSPSGSDLSPQWVGADRFVFVRDWRQLIVANVDGSGQRELTRGRVYPQAAPCVAPDGSRVGVVMGLSAGSDQELLVVAVDGAVTPLVIPTGIGGGGSACSWQTLWR